MKKTILFLFLTLITTSGFSEKILPLKGRVNDYAKIFKADEVKDLETMLKNYEDTTSTQIVVLTVETLEGLDVAEYAQNFAEHHKLGQKGKNNGLLLMIAMKERKTRIHTGYGMEASLPDAICKRILDDEMKEYLSDKKYHKGFVVGITKIMGAMSGEYQKEIAEKDRMNSIFINLLIIGVICGILGYFHWTISGIFGVILCLAFPVVGFAMFAWSILALGIFGAVFGILSHGLMSIFFGGGVTGVDPGDGIFFSGGSGGSGGGGFSGGGGSFGGGGASGSF